MYYCKSAKTSQRLGESVRIRCSEQDSKSQLCIYDSLLPHLATWNIPTTKSGSFLWIHWNQCPPGTMNGLISIIVALRIVAYFYCAISFGHQGLFSTNTGSIWSASRIMRHGCLDTSVNTYVCIIQDHIFTGLKIGYQSYSRLQLGASINARRIYTVHIHRWTNW